MDDPLLTPQQIREVEYERERYLDGVTDAFEFERCLDEILFPERHPELLSTPSAEVRLVEIRMAR